MKNQTIHPITPRPTIPPTIPPTTAPTLTPEEGDADEDGVELGVTYTVWNTPLEDEDDEEVDNVFAGVKLVTGTEDCLEN